MRRLKFAPLVRAEDAAVEACCRRLVRAYVRHTSGYGTREMAAFEQRVWRLLAAARAVQERASPIAGYQSRAKGEKGAQRGS